MAAATPNERALAVLRDMGTWANPPRSPDWNKYEIKAYTRGTVYIVDHNLDNVGMPGRTVKMQQHDERCMRVANFFDTKTPYQVECVSFTVDATEDDWDQYWEEELSTKDEDDLLIIYFHGYAYGTNREYKWKFQRGNLKINAHDFITKVNEGVSDCAFFLDCAFHTRKTRGLKWKLDTTSMTEFITSPYQVQNGIGAVIDHEGDWSKAFVRNMTRFMEGEILMPRWTTSLMSIPTLMARDHTMFHNQGSRFTLQRRKNDPGVVRRLVVDPVKVWSKGQYEFFGKQIQALPEEEPEVLQEPEDEGFGAEQYALDQRAREEDIAAGFGGVDEDGENEGDHEDGESGDGMFLN